MTSTAIRLFGSVALTLVSSFALSAEPNPSVYLLAVQIHDGSRLVGSPRVTVSAGHPSTIEINDAVGSHYEIIMTATPKSGQTVLIDSKIDVVSDGLHQSRSPHILVKLGEAAGIAFGIQSAALKLIRRDFVLVKAV